MQALISKTPLLRIIIPFIIGIIIASFWDNLSYFIGILTFGTIIYISYLKLKNPNNPKWTYNIPYISIFIIIFSLGGIITHYHSPKKINDSHHPTLAFLLVENIKDKESSIFVTGHIIHALDIENNPLDIRNKILLNIQGLNYNLKEGDIISFHPHLEPIKNMGNPDEFDYARYQELKGILYTQHLLTNEYHISGHYSTFTTFSRSCQRRLINYILSTSLPAKSQNFLITILLGDKNYLDYDIRESFSNIGLAHILALSGLHISIILIVLYFLFFPFDMFGYRKIRLVLTLLFAIAYMIVTGCSPSVVRALIMSSFVLISFMFYRKNNSINSLFGAGIVILFFSPYSLYDIGFQFSFLSVLSILVFAPLFQIASLKSKILSYPYNLLVITLSVILGTSILTLYYFHSFPTSIFISNLLILPLIPFLLIMGIISLCVPFSFAILIFDRLFEFVIAIVDFINKYLSFSINYISINHIDIIFYYLSIISIIWFWKLKERKALFSFIGIVPIWLISSITVHQTKPTERLIIYNDFVETPILFHNSTKAYIYNLPKDKEDRFCNSNSNLFAQNRIREVSLISDHISSPNLLIKDNIIYSNGKSLLLLSTKLPRANSNIENKLKLDYIIITKNYYGSIKKILQYYETKMIIISGNVYHLRKQKLIEECKRLSVSYHSISDNGAFQLIYD